jgi:hypothetical protein
VRPTIYRTGIIAIITSATLAFIATGLVPGATTALARAPSGETVASGFDNPRGLVFLRDRRLAVGESGHAGPICLAPGQCVGLNGQVTSVRLGNRHHTVLASGLPSFSGPFGAFGVFGLAVQDDNLYFVVGLNPQSFGDPATTCQGQADFNSCVAIVAAFVKETGKLDRVQSLRSNRGWQSVADVGRFDFDFAAAHPELSPNNPEWQPGDADPFGLIAGPNRGFYVVDAASNTLDLVSRAGQVQVLKFIPDPPTHKPIFDAAPTCSARAPNGDLYIGTESNTLWRWDGHALSLVLSGGKVGQVVGCVADRHGNIYLANLASRISGTFPDFNEKPFDGSIVKVTPGLTTTYVASGLNYPTGLALGEDGDLYVAVNGLCPADLSLLNADNSPPGACPEPGKVVRFDLERDQ